MAGGRTSRAPSWSNFLIKFDRIWQNFACTVVESELLDSMTNPDGSPSRLAVLMDQVKLSFCWSNFIGQILLVKFYWSNFIGPILLAAARRAGWPS